MRPSPPPAWGCPALAARGGGGLECRPGESQRQQDARARIKESSYDGQTGWRSKGAGSMAENSGLAQCWLAHP